MRKAPKTSPPPLTPKTTDRVTRTLEYRVITPLFGGGVETQTADPITVVRAQSVIGQLRFWWRACRAPGFPTPKAMYDQECEIWGSTSKPSRVVVDVTKVQAGTELTRVCPGPGRADYGVPAYAAFPLQTGTNKVVAGVQFKLEISYSTGDSPDVEAALWAWEMFGGVGGRTRRGFGSLQKVVDNGSACTPPQNLAQLRQSIERGLAEHVSPALPGVKVLTPHLRPRVNLSPPNGPPVAELSVLGLVQKNDAMSAWRYCIERYQRFRQARTPGSPRPGRSYWPEPDEIRRLTRTYDRHRPFDYSISYFPRALFGLPIIFQFQRGAGDPNTVTLAGVNGAERMASRLILKAVPLGQGAAGLAFVLGGPKLPHDSNNGRLIGAYSGEVRVVPPDGLTLGAPTERDPLKTRSDGKPFAVTQILSSFLKQFEQP